MSRKKSQPGIIRAIAKVGSQQALADALSVAQCTIHRWTKRGYIPAKHVQRVSLLTGVPATALSGLPPIRKPRSDIGKTRKATPDAGRAAHDQH